MGQASRALAKGEAVSTLQAFGHGCMASILMRGAVPIIVQSMAAMRRMPGHTGVRRRSGHTQNYRQHQRQKRSQERPHDLSTAVTPSSDMAQLRPKIKLAPAENRVNPPPRRSR
jgi:hypothetical protein